MSNPNKKDITKLREIHAAGENGIYTTEKQRANLLTLGLVEVNPKAVDPTNKNKIATRITQKGVTTLAHIDAGSEEEGNETVTETAQTEAAFELETGIAVPAVRRGRSGSSKYPFEKMEVNQSFHIAATEEKPNPAKALASTVSGATKRFKDAEGNVTRKFIVRRTDESDPKGPGARIFRIQ